MSLLDSIEFVIRFALGAFSAATWIWVIITFVLFVFVFGSLWGRAWNKEWSLTRHGGFLATVVILGLLASFAVFNLRSVGRMEQWFTEQRASLAHSVSDSGRLKRSVIVETWSRLEPKGGQHELAPPDQSGDQVRLNNPEDALVLASVAAEEARSSLRIKPPFLFGTPLQTASPGDIGAETLDALQLDASAYPRTVGSENEWTATAATLLVNQALDAAEKQLIPGLSDLKTASLALLALSAALALTFGALRALEDIKINSKP